MVPAFSDDTLIRRSVLLTILAMAATLVAGIAHPLLTPSTASRGLVGRYYASTDWTGPPLLERIDTELSTATLAATAELRGRTAFSAEWSGVLVTRLEARHQFATKSDDGSWLWLDDELVIDNGGLHAARTVAADVVLRRGVHPIRVRYLQSGGDYSLIVGQANHAGLFVHPDPLLPQPVSYLRLRIQELWPLALVAAWYAVLAALLVLAVRALARRTLFAGLADAARDRAWRWIAVGGLAFTVAHIGYGLPAHEPLSGDELDPLGILLNSAYGFDSWNLRWPPLHLSLLAAALGPFAAAASWFGLPLTDQTVGGLMFLVIRGVSVAMLAATLLLTFDIARTLTGRTAACFAVALLATSPLVVYFGSLANLEIPHLFWVTASFWAWLQLVRRRDRPAALALGATVGFSLATKDQAYGFYLLAPAALVWLVASSPEIMRRGAIAAVLGDRRLWTAALATLAAFAIGHHLPWGWPRLVAHVRSMVTTDSVPFRMFAPTADGYADLLSASLTSFAWAAGLPLTIAVVGGGVLMAASGRARLLAWLLAPWVTYLLGFVAVILFVYDRFMIATLPVASVIGGVFLSAIVENGRVGRAARLAVPAVLLLVATLNAAAQNVVFYRDPRHEAAAWLADHVPCGSSVGVTFNRQYVPSLTCFDVWPILPGQAGSMVRYPDRLVLNEAYANRFVATRSGQAFLTRLCTGELGFDLVYRAETSAPRWAPLFWEPRFSNRVEDPYTILDKPLHAVEVWQRRVASLPDGPAPAADLPVSSCGLVLPRAPSSAPAANARSPQR